MNPIDRLSERLAYLRECDVQAELPARAMFSSADVQALVDAIKGGA